MGKEEDRGSPFLIFPSNPSASTATAPPQRQRGRCCEDAGENSLLKESFRLPARPSQKLCIPLVGREEHTVCNVIYFRPHLPLICLLLVFLFFLRINFLISYLDSNRLTEHNRLTHTESFSEWQKAGASCTSRAFKHPGHDVTRTWRLAVNFDWLHIWFRAGQRWWRSP